jgi:hypothetical protein
MEALKRTMDVADRAVLIDFLVAWTPIRGKPRVGGGMFGRDQVRRSRRWQRLSVRRSHASDMIQIHCASVT